MSAFEETGPDFMRAVEEFRELEEKSNENAMNVTIELFKLGRPLFEQLKRCAEDKTSITSIVMSDDIPDKDKLRRIRHIILSTKMANSKIHSLEEILEHDLLKDKTNAEAFNILVMEVNDRLVKHNKFLCEIGKVIADESLPDGDKLEKIENLLAC